MTGWRETDHPRWPADSPQGRGGEFRDRDNPTGWLAQVGGRLTGRMTHAELEQYATRKDWAVVPDWTHGGNSAITTLRRYSDGRLLIHKEHDDAFEFDNENDGWESADMREVRASYIGWAVGAPVPAVVAADPDDYQGATLSEYIPGETAAAHLNINPATALDLDRLLWLERELAAKIPGGRELGMFDWLIGNDDRHSLNWIITPDGHAVGIDHANMDIVYEDTTSPFAEYLRRARIPWTRQEIEQIANRLLQLRLAGILHQEEHGYMVLRLDGLYAKATG
jgi:hypothetical protein